jgi:tetratricopeptide (TPR) repeat protein
MTIARIRRIVVAIILWTSAAIVPTAAGPREEAAALQTKVEELFRAGKYADAVSLAQRALALRENALGPNHSDVATSLSWLAGVYQAQGRYAETEPLYQRSLAIQEKALGRDHPEVGTALNNLAGLYHNQGRYKEAEPLFQRSLAIREKALGRDHPYVAQSLNNLAELYRDEGRYADAEPLYKRSLAILEKALGRDHPDVAVALNNLALLYDSEARYADAEPLYQRSLAIREKALGRDHPNVATALNNLAELYRGEGRYADAEPLYQRSLAIYEKAFGRDHPNVALSLNNLALLYDEQARYADAESLLQRSLAIRERALGPDHPYVAGSLNNLAKLYRNQGRYAEALPLVQRVIVQGRAKPAVALPVLIGAQHNKLISAETALDDSLNVAQRALQSSAAAAVNKLAVRLSAGSDRLSQLVRKDQDRAAEAESLDKTIIAAVARQPAQRDSANEQRIRNRLAAIAAERNDLQKTFAKEFPDYAALSNPLPLTGKEVQALLSADEALVLFSAGDKESYVFALTRDGFDWQAIPLGEQALEQKVAAFRRGLDAGVLLRGDWRGLFDLALAHELYDALIGPVEPLIRGKRHLMVVPSGALTALPFQLLVIEKPAFAVPLVQTVRDLAAYRDAAWLLKRHAVSVLPSIASLKALRVFAPNEQAKSRMIGFGDPIFNPEEENRQAKPEKVVVATRSYPEFWKGAEIDRGMLRGLPRLPETADELKAIAGKLGASMSDIHLQKDASETTVKRAKLADYNILYFATHGLVAGDVKGLGEPALALSIPKQPSELDDGLLTASEVAQLKLNADWVVLSACNTAAGDKPGAEALSGLARAFFYAGAHALLVSHWAVDSDAATRLTTTTFDILQRQRKIAGHSASLRTSSGSRRRS